MPAEHRDGDDRSDRQAKDGTRRFDPSVILDVDGNADVLVATQVRADLDKARLATVPEHPVSPAVVDKHVGKTAGIGHFHDTTGGTLPRPLGHVFRSLNGRMLGLPGPADSSLYHPEMTVT